MPSTKRNTRRSGRVSQSLKDGCDKAIQTITPFARYAKLLYEPIKPTLKGMRGGKYTNRISKVWCQTETKGSLDVIIVSDEVKKTDMEIAAYISCHSAICSVNHLTELFGKILKRNNAANVTDLKMHRTKCSMVIKNCIAPALLEELIEDINDSPYSLIIDESTDIAVVKYLCLCVRYKTGYFSLKQQKIISTYLGIIQIHQATAEVLVDHIIKFLKKFNLRVENLFGIGTDGGSNLCGKNNSVFSRLRLICPNLQSIKCVAHSLHLCCNKSAAELPASFDFLCKEIYNWFSKSPLRRHDYQKSFDLINLNENNKLHKFVQFAETRWLSRANSIKVIKEQWIELKMYFNMIVENEKNYMARMLKDMLNDNSNYIYLSIIYPILSSINKISCLFQQDTADIFKVYVDLYQLIFEILRFIIKPIFLESLQELTESKFKKIINILDNKLSFISLDVTDFGYDYREALKEYPVNSQTLVDIKSSCVMFLKRLCIEMCLRIPENIHLINCLKWFSLENCLKKNGRPTKLEQLLPLDIIKASDRGSIEQQWNNLVNVSWDVHNDCTESFWIKVLNYKNAGGELVFKELATLALKLCILPLSNAIVERIFSFLNYFKCKARNRMLVELLDALLLIKTSFNVKNICCKDFVPTKKIYSLFNSQMYDFINKNSNNNNDNNLEATDEAFQIFHDFHNH